MTTLTTAHNMIDDGAHILYVNGANREDTPLGRLMQDFFCESPERMHYEELAKRMDYFKGKPEGVNAMCELMEKFGERKLAEGREAGRAEGRLESARGTALALLGLGKLTLSQIAAATQLPLEEVERLAGTGGA